MGAEVVAVVRHERHREHAVAQGAAHVIVDAGDGFHKFPEAGGVDVAIDCVGQPTFNSTLRSLRLGGTAIAVGNLVPERVAVNLGLVITRALRIVGSSGASARDMADLLALAGAQPFTMPTRSFELAAAEEAQRALRAGGVHGRLVISLT
jgi:acryloyl-coenzyme A reductase